MNYPVQQWTCRIIPSKELPLLCDKNSEAFSLLGLGSSGFSRVNGFLTFLLVSGNEKQNF